MERFKIINKSKDGITLRLYQGKTLKMTWEEFNSNWIQVEGLMAEMKPEYKAVLDQVEDKLNLLTVKVRRSQVIDLEISKGIEEPGDKMERMSIYCSIGSLLEEISKSLDCSAVDVMKLVNQRLQLLMENSTPEFHKRYDKNYKKKYESSPLPSAKLSLGDHPEFDKLKDLFKD